MTRAEGKRPDLVDRVDLAERLGVSRTTMSRWDRRAILPEPDLRFGEQEVWLWATITRWARHRSTFRKRQSTPPLPDVVDLRGLAGRLGIEPRQAETWQRNGFLPEPDYRWERADGWLWKTIEAWVQSTPAARMPGRPMPPTALHPRQPRGPTLRTNEPASPAIAGRDSRSGTVDAVGVTPLARPDPVEDLGAIQLRFAAMGDDYQESSGENG